MLLGCGPPRGCNQKEDCDFLALCLPQSPAEGWCVLAWFDVNCQMHGDIVLSEAQLVIAMAAWSLHLHRGIFCVLAETA